MIGTLVWLPGCFQTEVQELQKWVGRVRYVSRAMEEAKEVGGVSCFQEIWGIELRAAG